MPPWLSVVVPTCGRPTLEWTLASVRRQASAQAVELIVVGDTYGTTWQDALGPVPALCAQYEAQYLAHAGAGHYWGHPQRQAGAAAAHGDWLLWSQDDDCLRPGAVATIRAAVRGQPAAPHLFRIWTRWAAWTGAIWRAPLLALGNVDADCLCVPNDPARLGQWAPFYAGDFAMICETCERWSRTEVWDAPIISIVRPDSVAGIEWTRTE